jgi:AcrR family transcriptional regulator
MENSPVRITKNKEERRQELIQVAERLFIENGYTDTSVSDIVRTTGVAQGTFYYHFKSKEEILEAIVHKSANTLDMQIRGIVEKTGEPPMQQIKTLLNTVFEFASTKRSLIAFVHLDSNALLHHRLMGTTARIIHDHLLALVQKGIQDGCFHVENPDDAVNFFLGGISGVLHISEMSQDPAHMQRFRVTAETALQRILGQKEGLAP